MDSQENESGLEVPVRRVTGASLEERMTENAYEDILPARYLLKDADGEVVEDPEDVFERVAGNIAIAEAVHTDEKVTFTPSEVKPEHPRRDELAEEIWSTLSFRLSDDGVLEVRSDTGDAPPRWEPVDESDAVSATELTEENAKWLDYNSLMGRLRKLDAKETAGVVRSQKQEFQEMMENLAWMPNSPTIMNAGDELQQLSACFVMSPDDDIGDIHETAKDAAETFQSGGGVGYAFWRLRPYGDAVGSTGGIASGPITFMRTYDQLCETIAQGGTRRGAQMGIMRVSHPDVIQFIHSKRKDVSLAHCLRLNDPDDFTHNTFVEALDEARELIDEEGRVPEHLRNAVEGHLSNFNISVAITDEFMEKVKAGEDYTFKNPRTGEEHIATAETKELYSRFGLGDEVEVGEPLALPAEDVWTRIIEGAHENGEPGVVFIDRINDEHSFPAESTPDRELGEYEIAATNPCGEQPLMENEPCNLGHINLSTVVDGEPSYTQAVSPSVDVPGEDTTSRYWDEWVQQEEVADLPLEDQVETFIDQAVDWNRLNRRIDAGTRFLDNVVTMSDFPTPEIEQAASDNRKIGLGIMGLAQMYVQMGVEYGSDVADEIARQVMTYINHRSKRVSHDMADERGTFENWEDSKFADPTEYREWFEKQTGESADDWEDGFPIRNHNTTTIAPTGTTSMLANCSGGCEPIYSVARFKNVSDDVQGDEKLIEFDDYFLQVLEANGIDTEAVREEATSQLKNNEWTGIRGLETVPNEVDELFVTTKELSAKEHASVQCALQDGVDSAISKTTNAPRDQTVEGAKETFEYIYENGGKGVTYYRQGTRSKQVLTTNDKEWEDNTEEEVREVLEDRGVEVGEDADIAEVVDSVIESETPEEEAGKPSLGSFKGGVKPRSRPEATYGSIRRVNTGYGTLYVMIGEDEHGLHEVFGTIGKSGGFTESMVEGMCRMASNLLRTGVDAEEVISQLSNIKSPKGAWDQGEQIQSIPDGIATAMRRHLEDPRAGYGGSSVEESGNQTEGEKSEEEEVVMANGGAVQELVSRGESPECPECGQMELEFTESCKRCGSCGWSEC